MAKVGIGNTRIRKISDSIIDLVNRAQADGANIDEAIAAVEITLGSLIRQRGAAMSLDQSVREALPLLALGYEQGIP